MERVVRSVLVVSGVLLAVAFIHAGIADGPVGEGFLDKWSYNVVLISGSFALVVRGFYRREERIAWMLLGIGAMIWTLGNIYYTTALWNMDVITVPSFADACWIAFYFFVYAGLIRLVRSRAQGLTPAMWIDSVIAALNVGCLAAAVIFEAIVSEAGASTLAVATNFAYPVGDVILVALVAGVAAMGGWRIGRTWLLILVGLSTFFVADAVYLVESAHATWVPGNIFEAGWPLAFLFMAFAAWRAPEPSVVKPAVEAMGLLAIPTVLSLIGLSVLVYDQFVPMNAVALTLSFASIIAIIVRMALLLDENRRRLARSEGEAVTDMLTGLGNRRSLMAKLGDICVTTSSEPTTLFLFDLNGFKRFNDTFGHPAGDALLVRLGSRLRKESALMRGSAYRLGGDEFCVLLPSVDAPLDAVERLRGALTASGARFSVGASYGSVVIPTEASEPSHALRMADRRLYADKRRDRGTAPDIRSNPMTGRFKAPQS